MAKVGKQTWSFKNSPRILGSSAVGGPKEGEGPLRDDFDVLHDDPYVGQKNWEKAEEQLLKESIQMAVKKAGLQSDQIDMVIAGDLINQISISNFSARSLGIPFYGIFGACSTSMQGLALAAQLVDSGYAYYAVAATSSHNATAERQFRYPTEYGGQKPPTAHCTVTGAGAALVGKGTEGPMITFATIGKVIDMGIKSPWEMGSAMAPAAADTILAHFRDTGRTPDDYDLIITGDLARVGNPIARDLLEKEGCSVSEKFTDCGILIYNPDQPDVFSGGSGCACCAAVTYGHLMKRIRKGDLKRVLVVATGALLSPLTVQQGETIPCIAHAVSIEAGGETS
ncbi:stage V sporulation protein AD [Effusibacillus lacus]|uniref:Stage V sporulation protein AD n=1 Tax=Effusibacillus lacus TaxID=1348429 RepID=A0A292YTT6_9BACL|nr:stage V sporulation protein AD [Effusibacillus lacus]TCS76308.1 stage V sporulation protein AD [Effusibacillus lacus]GAX91854.1 stage V sporulation protein AD [Effusibacillus lacus]